MNTDDDVKRKEEEEMNCPDDDFIFQQQKIVFRRLRFFFLLFSPFFFLYFFSSNFFFPMSVLFNKYEASEYTKRYLTKQHTNDVTTPSPFFFSPQNETASANVKEKEKYNEEFLLLFYVHIQTITSQV